MSNFYLMTRAAYDKLSTPVAKAALRAGLTPDSVTIIGTAGTVIAALTLFPIGQLWWGAVAVWFFVLADMLDGAMARVRGGGTRFGAVLDATCDRIGDGAVFCGLLWWAAFGLNSPVAGRRDADLPGHLAGDLLHQGPRRGQRPARRRRADRTARTADHRAGRRRAVGPAVLPVPWLLPIAMWVLAVASLITVAQRLHAVRTSPGATDLEARRERSRRRAERSERAVITHPGGRLRL